MAKANIPGTDSQPQPLSHNLLGQKLGKKGRDTRERIISATKRLLAEPRDTPISMSAVARDASLAMTTLYLYFSDLTEILLAVLEPIMASAEESYMSHLRTRWPDDELGEHCLKFVQAYHAFWDRHSRVLHLRNSLADSNDKRMIQHRITSAQPIIALLVKQMDGDPGVFPTLSSNMASVMLTGVERLVTLATDADFSALQIKDADSRVRELLAAEARLVELGIRDRRMAAHQETLLAEKA